jgi:hypothetical protein
LAAGVTKPKIKELILYYQKLAKTNSTLAKTERIVWEQQKPPYSHPIISKKGKNLSRLSEKLRTTFSRLVLEWGVSPRYMVNLPLNFQIARNGRDRKISRSIKGQSYDISETGIGILSEIVSADGLHAHFSYDMSTNTQVEIKLELPAKTIAITGETCRYQKMENGEYSYLLGIKIVNIPEGDRETFQTFISKLKREPHPRTPRY